MIPAERKARGQGTNREEEIDSLAKYMCAARQPQKLSAGRNRAGVKGLGLANGSAESEILQRSKSPSPLQREIG